MKFSNDNGIIELEVSYERGHPACTEGNSPAVAPTSVEESEKVTREESSQSFTTLDPTNDEVQPPSRCPFHKAAKQSKGKVSVDKNAETGVHLGDQRVKKDDGVCRHGLLPWL